MSNNDGNQDVGGVDEDANSEPDLLGKRKASGSVGKRRRVKRRKRVRRADGEPSHHHHHHHHAPDAEDAVLDDDEETKIPDDSSIGLSEDVDVSTDSTSASKGKKGHRRRRVRRVKRKRKGPHGASDASSSTQTPDKKKGKRRKKIKRKIIKPKPSVEFDIRDFKTNEEIKKYEAVVKKFHEKIMEKAADEKKAMIECQYLDKNGLPLASRAVTANFLRALRTAFIIGKVFGRWPFLSRNLPDGTISFLVKNCHPSTFYFMLINFFYTVLFLAGTWSYFSYYMNLPVGREWWNRTKLSKIYLRTRHERIVFDRHVVFFISAWAWLLIDIISGWHMFSKRKQVANYLTFWTRVILTMNMDVSNQATLPVLITLGFYGGAMVMILIFSFIKGFAPGSIGLPSIVAIILGRDYDDELLVLDKKSKLPNLFFVLTYAGRGILLFMYISSKVYILFFMVICKFLRNAFTMWNGRVYGTILKARTFIHTKEGRMVYSMLFKDHCALLDLLEGTDRVFSTVLESYFGLQAMSFCFEIYFVVHAMRDGKDKVKADKEDYYVRQWDFIGAIIMLLVHLGVFIYILRTSAAVAEEAVAGMEVIRRKTMLGRTTDEELFFMMSMFSSYTSHKPIGITSGGFFLCNKSFNLGICAVIVAYFTIVVQFKPQFDFKREPNELSRQQVKQFLDALEGTHNA